MNPTLGLWIDDAPKLVGSDSFWEDFVGLGFRTAAIMLESTSAGFDPKFGRGELEVIGERCRRADIELVLTVWPEPRAPYMAEMVEKLPPLLKASGAAALEFDAESNWHKRKLQGFISMEHAADALVRVLQKFRELDVRSELTTFTMHGENSRRAVLADDVDRLLPQAYSVLNRDDADGKPMQVAWDHAYGPGSMQRLTLDRALQVPRKNGKPKLACGLAAYDQKWPSRTGEEAMRVAFEEALRHDPVELRWWSSKWVIGARKTDYAARFFRSL